MSDYNCMAQRFIRSAAASPLGPIPAFASLKDNRT